MSDNRFDPRKELDNLRQSVERVFEQGKQTVQSFAQNAQGIPVFRVDVYELEDSIVVKTSPIDGIVADSIDVTMEENILTIAGDTRPEPTPSTASYLVQERRFGAFSRQIIITVPVISAQAKAKLKDSALTITLPLDKSNK